MPGPTTVYATKELTPTSYAPLVLCEFQFLDGTFLYVSTAPLNSAEGGFPYSSNNYLARISSQQIAALSARSSEGIDRVPSVTITLADPDKTLYSNYESVTGKGFKGAILTLRLVFWQADTSNFSSDSQVLGVFICDPPNFNQGMDLMTVTAKAAKNTAKAFLPVFHVQPRCGNIFPATAAQRLAGATDMSSDFWSCGYNPDQVGTDPEIGGDCRRGNLNGGSPFTTCNLTKQDCVLRGMYGVDSMNRATGRFSGNQWQPPNREVQSKSYLQGKTVTVLQARNDAAYMESYPMLYGTQWVRPIITAIPADANSTRFIAVVCQDDIGTDGILQVVVNGVIVPQNGSSPDNALYRWNFQSQGSSIGGGGGTPVTTTATGSRNGAPCRDTDFNSLNDPMGSLASIEVVVYSQIAQAGSVPDVMILAQGPKIKTPTTSNPADQPTWPKVRTNNFSFCLLDTLIWSNFKYTDFDLQSFIDEASYCNSSVTYTDLNGNSTSHAAYISEYVLQQPRTAAECVAALLRGCNGQLLRSPSTGLVRFLIRKTLADQQSSPIAGSNYNTSVLSQTAYGAAASGYVAYKIDESVIQKDGDTGIPLISMSMVSSGQAPNRVTFPFQDADNSYAQDSLSTVDADAANRAGGYQGTQEVVENWNVLGISNFDQGTRVSNTYLSEIQRGNENQDTRGTRVFSVKLTVRAASLQVGQIVLFQYQQLGLQPLTQLQSPAGTPIDGILCRITQIQPDENYETCTVTMSWHEDIWYTWAYAQSAAPLNSDSRNEKPNRPPYPWQPYGIQPITNDSLYWSPSGRAAGSWWLYGIAQSYTGAADGTFIGQATITGCPPVTALSAVGSGGTQPPVIGVQGATASTGGSIPGGITVYMAISAIDSSGNETALSKLTTVVVPSGTNTNTVTTPAINWQSGTVGYVLYAGPDGNNLTEQARNGASTPGTITLTALNLETYGPPDILADHLHFQAKRVIHGGVWGDEVTAVGTNALQFTPPSSFTTNQWVGYDIQKVANNITSTAAIEVANFSVTANNGNTLTVTPDPVAAGVTAGDVFIMLIRPDPSSTASKIVEPNLINAYAPSGLNTNEGQYTLRILAGTGKSEYATIASNDATSWTLVSPLSSTPDTTTRPIIEEVQWTQDIDTDQIINASSTALYSWNFDITNFKQQTILTRVNVEDANGNPSGYAFAPMRMMYVWGKTGTLPVTPDPVTIMSLTYGYSWSNPSLQATSSPDILELTLIYSVPGGWAGTGVHVYYEDPDASAAVAANLSGSQNIDGSANIGGNIWPIVDAGKFPDDTHGHSAIISGSAAGVKLAISSKARDIRVYAQAFNSTYDPPPVRAYETGPTPNAVVSVPAQPGAGGGTGPGGNEAAQNVTGISVNTTYSANGSGQWVLTFNASWTPPLDTNWAGVVVELKYAMDPGVSRIAADRGGNPANAQQDYKSPVIFGTEWSVWLHQFPSATIFATVTFRSVNNAGVVNSYVNGITPELKVEIDAPPKGNAGEEFASLVIAFTAVAVFSVGTDGVEKFGFSGTVTPPSNDAQFGGYVVMLHNQANGTDHSQDQTLGVWGPGDLNWSTDSWPIPSGTTTYDAYCVSYDVNNNQNSLQPGLTPRVTGLVVTAQTSGSMVATRLASSTYSTAFANLSSKFDLATGGIDASTKIQAATIVQALMANASVGNAQIINASVDDAKMINVSIAKLLAGTATFSGTATFQVGSGGPSVQITSTGVTLAAGGTPTITLSSSTGSITGMSLSLTVSSVTTAINTGSLQNSFSHGVSVTSGSYGAYLFCDTNSNVGGAYGFFGASSNFTLFANGGSGVLIMNGGGYSLQLRADVGQVLVQNLPTSNPGAGTKQLWADPSDSYRVKFAN